MVRGADFEVSKEVYERAREASCPPEYREGRKSFYMADQDRNELFSDAIRWGYGLYDCQVTATDDGRYICSWWRGESCD